MPGALYRGNKLRLPSRQERRVPTLPSQSQGEDAPGVTGLGRHRRGRRSPVLLRELGTGQSPRTFEDISRSSPTEEHAGHCLPSTWGPHVATQSCTGAAFNCQHGASSNLLASRRGGAFRPHTSHESSRFFGFSGRGKGKQRAERGSEP